MKTYKANDGNAAEINIRIDLPKFKTLEHQRIAFTDEGERIERTLYESLPGGVYDQLLGAMHNRKASHYIVTHKP